MSDTYFISQDWKSHLSLINVLTLYKNLFCYVGLKFPFHYCFWHKNRAPGDLPFVSVFTLRPSVLHPMRSSPQHSLHTPRSPFTATAPVHLVTGQEGESCLRTFDCGPGLCCARHFWTKICKPVLLEGQVCSRRGHKDTAQAPEIFQRCDCGPGLVCRSQVTGNRQHARLRVCQKI